MIPAPKLDDRTYADIVAEAMRLIPRYCPEWTDHNPSDPGITILELTAWMTELILYRLNRVPEKNYLAFLDMIGIKLRSPQPARGLITFQLVEGADRQVIKEATQVATQQAAEDDTIVFETQKELVVVGAPLDRCFSYFHETYSDNSAFLNGARPEGFEVFAGADRVDRFLYLGDPRFKAVSDSSVLKLMVSTPDHGGRDLARLLEWEYWNGRRWRELKMMTVEVERGEVVFNGPQDMSSRAEHGIDDVWVRGRLAEVPQNPWETEIDTVKAVIETGGEGVNPDHAFANLDGGVFLALDLGKNSHPLGTSPKIDQCFYIASREILSQPEAEVRIEILLSDPAIIPEPKASENLILSWEYFDGKKWRILGKSTPKGSQKVGDNDWAFVDTTFAFTKSGAVTFRVPRDMHAGEVNGEDNFWVRARIEIGDYGLPGSYMLDGDKWVWRDDRPLRPPAFKSVSLKYRADLQNVKHVLSYNDFRYRDHSEEAKVEYRPFQPFSAVPDEGAALYLGWNGKLPNDPVSIYVMLADAPARAADERSNSEFLKGYYADRDAAWEAEQRVVWEYFDGTNWQPLVVIDGTKNFAQSGFVDFVGPDDHAKALKFTEDRYWIRARLEMGGYVKPPRVQRVLTNTVEAANVVTVRDETLGSSDGMPMQAFGLSHGPLLEGEVIEVRERDVPAPEDIVDLGDDPVRAAEEQEGGGHWVRWRAVESFFDSGPRSRHYIRNPINGKIQFGDGTRGLMPPAGRNNIVARRYQVGGGVRGNVNSMTLTQLTRAIAYIDKCYNAMPAAGGADAESVDEAKARAPLVLKSRDRAVTAEDFESLALRASTGVARAKCLPSQRHDGEVQAVIVPRGDEKNLDLTKKLIPAPELLRFVKNYLDERRLVGTVVEVIKPGYIEISLKVTLVRRTVGQSDRLKREIEDRLRRYLHPLVGGRDGKGWPFGRAVYKTDLAHLVEDVPGVEVIDAITIFDEDKRVAVENVRLDPSELIYLVNVAVVERVREEIV
jgi:Baseplate J-like protein